MSVSSTANKIESVMLTPPIKTIRGWAIPFSALIQVVCKVPEGKVAVDSQVIAILRSAYGDDKLEYELSHEAIEALNNEAFPFWRLVTPNGYLTSFDPFHSKDWQKRKLEGEGVKVIEDQDGILRVRDFDSLCFDLDDAVKLKRLR